MTVEEFFDAYGRITSHGWLTIDEALLLVKYAERTEGTIVEVGSYFGRSAMLLCQLLDRDFSPPRYKHVHCVDPWDDEFSDDMPGEEIYKKFVGNLCGLQSEIVIGGFSVSRCKVEDWTPIPAGFVYLDGDHTYEGTITQIEKALQCNPTYIALHDYAHEGGGKNIVRAATEKLGQPVETMGRLAVFANG